MIIYADFTSAYCYLASLRVDRLMAAGRGLVDWRAVEHRPGLPRSGLQLSGTAQLIRGRELAAARCLLAPREEFEARNPRFLPNTQSANARLRHRPRPRARRRRTTRPLRRLLGAGTAHWSSRRVAARSADNAEPEPVDEDTHTRVANRVVEPGNVRRPHARLRTRHRMRPGGVGTADRPPLACCLTTAHLGRSNRSAQEDRPGPVGQHVPDLRSGPRVDRPDWAP